jgi:hypothetical protein
VSEPTSPPKLASWARPAVVPLLLVALVFSFVAVRDLDSLLRAKHPSGSPAYGATDLVSIPKAAETQERLQSAVDGWLRYEELVESRAASPSATAKELLLAYVVVDSIFALIYGLALALVFLRTQRGAVQTAFGGGTDQLGRRSLLFLLPVALVELAVGFDLMENVATWLIVDRLWETGGAADLEAARMLMLLTTGKLLLVAIVGIPALFLLYWAAREHVSPHATWRVVRRLRVHLLIPVGFALLLVGHEQMPDLIRRWTVVELGYSVLATLVLAVVLWLAASKLLAIGASRSANLISKPVVGYGLVALFLVVAIVAAVIDVGWGLLIPAVIACIVALVSALVWLLRPPGGDGETPSAAAVESPAQEAYAPEPRRGGELLLPAVVLGGLGVATFHASFAFAIDAREWSRDTLIVLVVVVASLIVGVVAARLWPGRRVVGEPLACAAVGAFGAYLYLRLRAAFDDNPARDEVDLSLLALTGLLLGVAAPALAAVLGRHDGARKWTFRIGMIVLSLASVVLGVLFVAWPWTVAERMGGIALLGGFLVLVTAIAFGAVWVADAVPAPPALRALRVKGIPVLTLVVVWFVLAAILDPGGYHDARTHRLPAPPAVGIGDVWCQWFKRNGLPRPPVGPFSGLEEEPCGARKSGSRADAQPLVFVSSTGGGMRAAYWTALVLDCAFEADASEGTGDCTNDLPRRTTFDRSDAVFVASGISGGSLGIAAYGTYLQEKSTGERGGETDWVHRRLDADSLSASVAWWLFVEGAQSLLRFHNQSDRAEILERGWERDWADGDDLGDDEGLAQGFRSMSTAAEHVPLMLLNGTSVSDGCRINVSPLDASIVSVPPVPPATRCSRIRALPLDGPIRRAGRLRGARPLGATRPDRLRPGRNTRRGRLPLRRRSTRVHGGSPLRAVPVRVAVGTHRTLHRRVRVIRRRRWVPRHVGRLSGHRAPAASRPRHRALQRVAAGGSLCRPVPDSDRQRRRPRLQRSLRAATRAQRPAADIVRNARWTRCERPHRRGAPLHQHVRLGEIRRGTASRQVCALRQPPAVGAATATWMDAVRALA